MSREQMVALFGQGEHPNSTPMVTAYLRSTSARHDRAALRQVTAAGGIAQLKTTG